MQVQKILYGVFKLKHNYNQGFQKGLFYWLRSAISYMIWIFFWLRSTRDYKMLLYCSYMIFRRLLFGKNISKQNLMAFQTRECLSIAAILKPPIFRVSFMKKQIDLFSCSSIALKHWSWGKNWRKKNSNYNESLRRSFVKIIS